MERYPATWEPTNITQSKSTTNHTHKRCIGRENKNKNKNSMAASARARNISKLIRIQGLYRTSREEGRTVQGKAFQGRDS